MAPRNRKLKNKVPKPPAPAPQPDPNGDANGAIENGDRLDRQRLRALVERKRPRQENGQLGTVYAPDLDPVIAERLTGLGHTAAEVGRFLGVHRSTITDWIRTHPEFGEAMDRGRAVRDEKVEKSLFRRATGFRYVERQVETLTNGKQRVKTTTKLVVPEVVACIFWLKNRDPERWRDVQEHAGAVSHTLNLKGAGFERLSKALDKLTGGGGAERDPGAADGGGGS